MLLKHIIEKQKFSSVSDVNADNDYAQMVIVVKTVKLFLKAIVAWQFDKKVQVGKDQEKAQSEKDSHSKNQGGKKPN